MSGLLDVTTILVPRSVMLEAHTHLQQVGFNGLEGFALWAGVQNDHEFVVHQTIIPAQRGLRLPSGLMVHVAGEELHRINLWLYEHQFTLIAQLHSHPSEAYHSETDNTYPIATTEGCLSLVLPHFASRSFSLTDCAVYCLTPMHGWQSLTPDAVIKLIKIVDDHGSR